jgi:aspartate kinase
MLVYKFGGASVKNAKAVEQLKKIVANTDENLIIVISAMGKTTNKLEAVLAQALQKDGSHLPLISNLKACHLQLVEELFVQDQPIKNEVDKVFLEIIDFCNHLGLKGYDYAYDQIVSFGELLSTKIISKYLEQENIENKWIDIRKVLKTDNNFREANVDIELSLDNSREIFNFEKSRIYLTQGFIASDDAGNTTTLGREGSDYTSALLSSFLKAENLTLWKDVSGIYNADPAIFNDAELLPELSYQEMIELAFYGAKVIHPKTIKPLKEADISLFVKCFSSPDTGGTEVSSTTSARTEIPIYILKDKQVLVSISNRDLSFINENHLSKLFGLLSSFRLKANIIQHSAVSFSVCVDTPLGKEVVDLIAVLKNDFKVLYNEGLQILTIRNYTEKEIQKLTAGKKIFIEQRSRNTVQFVTD